MCECANVCKCLSVCVCMNVCVRARLLFYYVPKRNALGFVYWPSLLLLKRYKTNRVSGSCLV